MTEKKTIRRMKDRPEKERPYEKCIEYGPESLSDGELLAVLLRTGSQQESSLELAWKLLDLHPVYKGLVGLYHVAMEDLLELSGIGQVKAITILCLLELSKRLSQTSFVSDYDFSCPEQVASYYMEQMRHRDKERVLLLLMDQRGHRIRDLILSDGDCHSANVPMKDIFIEALKYHAEFVILMHNHPSGHPEASREDILLTDQVKKMGEVLGIPLKDHIIIGDRCYFSMLEQGLL